MELVFFAFALSVLAVVGQLGDTLGASKQDKAI